MASLGVGWPSASVSIETSNPCSMRASPISSASVVLPVLGGPETVILMYVSFMVPVFTYLLLCAKIRADIERPT